MVFPEKEGRGAFWKKRKQGLFIENRKKSPSGEDFVLPRGGYEWDALYKYEPCGLFERLGFRNSPSPSLAGL
jgi:hypothetical protein